MPKELEKKLDLLFSLRNKCCHNISAGYFKNPKIYLSAKYVKWRLARQIYRIKALEAALL